MNFIKNQVLKFPQSQISAYFTKIALIAFAYVLGGKLAVSIPGVALLGSSVWPPAGIAQASLLLFGLRFWPGVALGSFLFDVIDLKPSLMFGLGASVGAGLQAALAVFLLHRFGFRASISRLTDVVKLIFCGAIFATQVSCTLGALRLCFTGLTPWSEYWQVRWNWWLGDAMGVVIFTPLLLIFWQNSEQGKTKNKWNNKTVKEAILPLIWLVLLMAVSWVVFASKNVGSISRYPLEYLPFPLIIWAAIQFGQRGAILSSFIVSCIAIWGGSQGGGPFITKAENISQAILFLQAFMGVITITSLLLAATVAERASAETLLRQSEIKYRELVESANSIILQIDRLGNITFFNEFAQKFFGYSEDEILGKNVIGTIFPVKKNSQTKLSIMLADIFHYPERYVNCENKNMRRNGELVWVSWANKVLSDESGNLTGVLCVGTDITDRKKAEIALKKLNEELETRVEERTKTLKQILEKLRYQQEQSERLLLNILPEPIAEQLKLGNNTIADTFANVTVLFADIVGFTQLSSRVSPSELVRLLNEIFSTFDRLAEKHGLEKIKTIGDAYMVVGGLPMPRSDHAEAIAEMALDMQTAIAQFGTSYGESFSIRIGINSGPVVAGVIGIKKFIYDLWGDTVNTASRMESHGLPGCIQVTSATYELLKDKYLFENRGSIHIKGKGEMITYFLTEKKPLSSPWVKVLV